MPTVSSNGGVDSMTKADSTVLGLHLARRSGTASADGVSHRLAVHGAESWRADTVTSWLTHGAKSYVDPLGFFITAVSIQGPNDPGRGFVGLSGLLPSRLCAGCARAKSWLLIAPGGGSGGLPALWPCSVDHFSAGTPHNFSSKACISGSCCRSSSRVKGKKSFREK
jgi:hypothetical protein